MVDKQEVQRQTAGLLQKDTEGQNRERERQNHTGRYPLRDWRPLNITGQTEDFTLLLVGDNKKLSESYIDSSSTAVA